MSGVSLPEGWVVVQLGDVCSKVTDGSHNPPSASVEGLPMLSAKNIHDGRIDFDADYRLIPIDSFAQEDKRTKIVANDILLTIVGALGRVAVVQKNTPKFTLQRSVAVFSAPMINPNYLRFSFEDNLFQQQILDNAKGTAQKGIYLKKLKELTVVLAPLTEQQQIAQKLDELLAQVDTLKTRLDAIPKILKRFRQSVLAAAVSGKLTEEWRGLNKLNYYWEELTFNDICEEITVGFVGKMKDQYIESGVPFLRSQNVRKFKFSPENILYISEAFHKEIYKSRLNAGDLAIVRSGAPGTTCVIPKNMGEMNCSDLVIARPGAKLLSDYGCIFMNSEVAQKNVSDNQVGVAQQHFNVGSMKKMPISLPSLQEQTEIVRRVEQLFTYADQIEQRVIDAQVRVNHLTQSILAKAFRGELTADWRAQNPDLISGENSAAKLLERIKAEREATAKPKRKIKA